MLVQVKFGDRIYAIETPETAKISELEVNVARGVSSSGPVTLFCDSLRLSRDRTVASLDASKQLLAMLNTSTFATSPTSISPTTASPSNSSLLI